MSSYSNRFKDRQVRFGWPSQQQQRQQSVLTMDETSFPALGSAPTKQQAARDVVQTFAQTLVLNPLSPAPMPSKVENAVPTGWVQVRREPGGGVVFDPADKAEEREGADKSRPLDKNTLPRLPLNMAAVNRFKADYIGRYGEAEFYKYYIKGILSDDDDDDEDGEVNKDDSDFYDPLGRSRGHYGDY
jgi:hypothetical protein